MTHLQVPLKNLRFGHEAPNHPGNARVQGREEGIAELAAHIHARGKIDDLLVYDDGVPEVYFVANGNRSLAALRMIHTEQSEFLVDCKLTTPEQAYEDSLAVAVLAKKFHPIDEYEGFALLLDKGKSEEEIGLQYGKTPREVQQVMALGHLSQKVRDAWRKGELKAGAAKAFTLAADHAAQDKVLDQLRAEAQQRGDDMSGFDDYDVKEILEIDTDGGMLVEFVGIDAYVARGGKVTRDLFGMDHQISDLKLAQKMADERLVDECKRLKDEGWSFAVPLKSVGGSQYNYTTMKAEPAPDEQETARLAELDNLLAIVSGTRYAQMPAEHQRAFVERHERRQAITSRAFTDKMRAKSGCFVSVNDDGLLDIVFGKVKPAQKEQAAKVAKEENKGKKKAAATAAAAAGAPAPEPTELSGALKERLEAQLVDATREAISACLDTDHLKSPLSQVMGRLICSQIKVNGASVYIHAPGLREKLPVMREAMPATVINNAILKHFDAAAYFGSAPKGFVIKAIAETINPDEARKAAQGSKRELAEFAIKNLKGTGWVPKELRTSHYVVPVVKKPEPSPAAAKPAAAAKPPPAGTAAAVKAAKAARATKKNELQLKRAAAAKKSAKKTSKKKR